MPPASPFAQKASAGPLSGTLEDGVAVSSVVGGAPSPRSPRSPASRACCPPTGSLHPTSMRIGEDGCLVVNFKTEAQFHGLFVLSHPGKARAPRPTHGHCPGHGPVFPRPPSLQGLPHEWGGPSSQVGPRFPREASFSDQLHLVIRGLAIVRADGHRKYKSVEIN